MEKKQEGREDELVVYRDTNSGNVCGFRIGDWEAGTAPGLGDEPLGIKNGDGGEQSGESRGEVVAFVMAEPVQAESEAGLVHEKAGRRNREKKAKETDSKDGSTRKKRYKEGTYRCSICERVFKYSWHLKDHHRVHSQDRDFACSFPGCGRSYKRKGDLNIHRSTIHSRIPL